MEHFGQTLSAWMFVSVGLLSTATFALVVGLLASGLVLVIRNIDRRSYFGEVTQGVILGFAIGFLAWVTGYLTGASRVSVAGDVLPAVLGSIGVIGGIVSLRFGHSVQVAIVVLCFGFSLFVGSTTGAKLREQHEYADQGLPPLEFLKSEARKEADIKKYREELGLEWPPPKPADDQR